MADQVLLLLNVIVSRFEQSRYAKKLHGRAQNVRVARCPSNAVMNNVVDAAGAFVLGKPVEGRHSACGLVELSRWKLERLRYEHARYDRFDAGV